MGKLSIKENQQSINKYTNPCIWQASFNNLISYILKYITIRMINA